MNLVIAEIAAVLIVLAGFSFVAYYKKVLDKKGVLIGNIVGLLTYIFGNSLGIGIPAFLTIVYFFIVGELNTRYARKISKKEHEQRSTGNILGNSGAALISLALLQPVAFFGAMATALSDTMSSENGMLSKKKPFLITNFKEVETGTDGGITVLGELFAVIGAFLIAAIYYAVFQNIAVAIAIAFAGFFGQIIDSILGALFERKKLISNTWVNFFACLSGAGLAYVLSLVV